MFQSLQLPRDLFSRDDAETEWWYYHGHLEGNGRRFGFHLVFFRRRTGRVRIGRFLQLGKEGSHTRCAHFALADIDRRQFRYGQHRSHFRRAGAAQDRFEVWSDDWSARQIEDCHAVEAKIRGVTLDVSLRPRKPAISHGLNGYFPKFEGGKSLYFSYPRLEVDGRLVVDDEEMRVTGQAWMDREIGQFGLWERIHGWDWFAIQLDDDRELIVYRLRNHAHEKSAHSGAVLINRDHSVTQIAANDFEIAPLGTWQSPKTGNIYPLAWRVCVPKLDIYLNVEPFMQCNELDTRGSTNVIYWEGPGEVRGTVGGSPVNGRCFMELVGYERKPNRIGSFDFLNNRISFAGFLCNELRLRLFGPGVVVQDLGAAR